jgi:hypothetical protein
MGLLDNLMGTSVDDPRFAATTQLAQGLLSSPRLMQGLAQGLGGYQQAMAQAKQAKMLEEMRQMQMAQQKMQMEEAQRQQAQSATDREGLKFFATPMSGGAAIQASGALGPTMGAASLIGQLPPPSVQDMVRRGMSVDGIKSAFALADIGKPEGPLITKAGDVARDRKTGKVIWQNDDKDSLPADFKLYQLSGAPDRGVTFDQWDLQRKRAGATKVQVDAGQRFENAYSQDQGKFFSELKGNVTRAGFSAPTQLRKLERMEQLLTGVDGGKLSPVGLEVASALNSLGFKVDPKLGNKEASEALARDMAGGMRQPGTGPMTDKDYDNFLLQIPSLSKTAEGRRQIIATQRNALNRDAQVAKMAREYQKRNGVLDDGFMEEVSQYIAENPVVAAPDGWKVW